MESGVGSEGIIPKLLHCGGASEVTQTEPFEDAAPLIGLASAKGHRIKHWLKENWTNEHIGTTPSLLQRGSNIHILETPLEKRNQLWREIRKPKSLQ